MLRRGYFHRQRLFQFRKEQVGALASPHHRRHGDARRRKSADAQNVESVFVTVEACVAHLDGVRARLGEAVLEPAVEVQAGVVVALGDEAAAGVADGQERVDVLAEAVADHLEADTLAGLDLDGETVAYAALADTAENLSAFVDRLFRRPWEIVSRRAVLRKVLRRIVAARTLNPVYWYVLAASSLHCFVWARAYPSRRRNYLAGEDVLDPQYSEYLEEITDGDQARYFKPVALTDPNGLPVPWLQAFIPRGRLSSEATDC